MGQHLQALERDLAFELAVGGEVEEVEPPLLDTGRVGLLVELGEVLSQRRRGRRRSAAQQGGHGAGFGQTHRGRLVHEFCNVLRRHDVSPVGDDGENVVLLEVVDGNGALDGRDGIADVGACEIAEVSAAHQVGRTSLRQAVVGVVLRYGGPGQDRVDAVG